MHMNAPLNTLKNAYIKKQAYRFTNENRFSLGIDSEVFFYFGDKARSGFYDDIDILKYIHLFFDFECREIY